MTIYEAQATLSAQLSTIYEAREASNIADLVMEQLTGKSRSARILMKQDVLTEAQLQYFMSCLSALLLHKPVQYVLGEAWFGGMLFKVNEQVLIPRPETEELAEWVISDLPPDTPVQVVDIGTGSGCIAVTIKKKCPLSLVSGIDISKGALAIARQNAVANHAPVTFIELDFLQETSRAQLGNYDVIVSNPPYIPLAGKDAMKRHVTDFEPAVALYVPDAQPLLFYQQIAVFADTHLNPEGAIYMEIQNDMGAAVTALFKEKGWGTIELRKDMQGEDRMVKVKR
jgi:release factor glutamine methyltransferase